MAVSLSSPTLSPAISPILTEHQQAALDQERAGRHKSHLLGDTRSISDLAQRNLSEFSLNAGREESPEGLAQRDADIIVVDQIEDQAIPAKPRVLTDSQLEVIDDMADSIIQDAAQRAAPMIAGLQRIQQPPVRRNTPPADSSEPKSVKAENVTVVPSAVRENQDESKMGRPLDLIVQPLFRPISEASTPRPGEPPSDRAQVPSSSAKKVRPIPNAVSSRTPNVRPIAKPVSSAQASARKRAASSRSSPLPETSARPSEPVSMLRRGLNFITSGLYSIGMTIKNACVRLAEMFKGLFKSSK